MTPSPRHGETTFEAQVSRPARTAAIPTSRERPWNLLDEPSWRVALSCLEPRTIRLPARLPCVQKFIGRFINVVGGKNQMPRALSRRP